MFIRNWKQNILTIPNILSLMRLVLIPVYMSIYLNATQPVDFCMAGLILSLSCATDAVDGMIARRFHMESTLGKILDPAADKITQFSLMMCLQIRHTILKPVFALFIVKEILQLFLGAVYLMRGKMLPGALPAGKLCTAALFVSLIFLVLFPQIHPSFVKAIAATNSLLLLMSLIFYLFAYWGRNPIVQDMHPDE